MSIVSESRSHRKLLRTVNGVFAFVLGATATWILAAELLRPGGIIFPKDVHAARVTAQKGRAAGLAAEFGAIRGALWADFSLTYFDLVLPVDKPVNQHPSDIRLEEGRSATKTALRLAPHASGIWLELAALDRLSRGLGHESAAALRMSYYTGPNNANIIPLRLRLALDSPELDKGDFQQLVAHDIRLIMTHRPDLKSAVAVDYKQSLRGRGFLLDQVEKYDLQFAAELQKQDVIVR